MTRPTAGWAVAFCALVPNTRWPVSAAVMARLMEERYPIYATADIAIQTRDERREIIAGEVLEALKARLVESEPAPERSTK